MTNRFQSPKQSLTRAIKNRAETYQRIRTTYLTVNKSTGGALGVMRHAVTNFTIARGSEASASLAYYALFSIFPVLLAIVSIGSYFLERELVKTKLLEAVMSLLPISAATINQHIDSVFQMRGAVTTVALISLVWSAINVFQKVIINVNRAFPQGRTPGFLYSQAIALAIFLLLILLFILSLSVNTFIGVIPGLNVLLNGKPLTETMLWGWVAWILPLLMKFLMFLGIYHWLPRDMHILFKAKWIGALTTALLWELATRILTWTISSGLANYQLVYGSLASMMVLLFWLYMTGYILFFGAHLTNAINYHLSNAKPNKPNLNPEKVPGEV